MELRLSASVAGASGRTFILITDSMEDATGGHHQGLDTASLFRSLQHGFTAQNLQQNGQNGAVVSDSAGSVTMCRCSRAVRGRPAFPSVSIRFHVSRGLILAL
jgi:hypothetical protein